MLRSGGMVKRGGSLCMRLTLQMRYCEPQVDIETCPELINIGLDDFTINEYYSEVADVIDWEGKFIHDLTRPVGMNQKLCDTRRATEWAGVANIPRGIEETYKFYCERYGK